ncbi:hypothetical protein O181_079903 [Austropuccinia psidii MF-1]|uniref:Uncharacterized protein n=1 Tax=Austropuccinia psidii MF-1 TaxID=1389203 RepID=A0A9Q3IG22_9BASI|nr:hypothetical protein [Austropuccinia psidii MF-1]
MSGSAIPSRKQRFNSLDCLRHTYRLAAKAFLHNDHLVIWSSLSTGLASIQASWSDSNGLLEHTRRPWWISSISPHHHRHQQPFQSQEPVEPSSALNRFSSTSSTSSFDAFDHRINQELHQLDRKFQILKITYLASIASQPASENIKELIRNHLDSVEDDHQVKYFNELLSLLNLPSDQLIHSLWSSLHQADSNSINSSLTPLASPDLATIHPSIVTAISLASIKLNLPRIGKQICEAWLGSLDDQTLDYLDWLFQSSHSPPSSSISITNQLHSTPSKRPSSDIRYSYERLIEVYCVQILSRLDEREFAIGFVQNQNRQLGGILSVDTVQNILDALDQQQAHQSYLINLAIQKQLKIEELQKQRLSKQTSSSHTKKQTHSTNLTNSNQTHSTSSRQPSSHFKASNQAEGTSKKAKPNKPPSNPNGPINIKETISTLTKETKTSSNQSHKGFSIMRDCLSRFVSNHHLDSSRPQTESIGMIQVLRYSLFSKLALIQNKRNRIKLVGILLGFTLMTLNLIRRTVYKANNNSASFSHRLMVISSWSQLINLSKGKTSLIKDTLMIVWFKLLQTLKMLIGSNF